MFFYTSKSNYNFEKNVYNFIISNNIKKFRFFVYALDLTKDTMMDYIRLVMVML